MLRQVKRDVAISPVAFKRRMAYFREASEEIAAANLRMLFAASVMTLGLLAVFLLVTPYVIRGWTPTLYHLALIPVACWVCLITGIQYHIGVGRPLLVLIQCVLYQATIFCFIILVDTAGTPAGPAAFVPLLFIALPALFVVPHMIAYAVVLFFEAIYIIAVCTFKAQQIGQYDIFISLVGLAFSVALNNLILSLRISDHEMQMKYKVLSTMDYLSDILNKQTCLQVCKEYLQTIGRDSVCSLLILDLDDFKAVNDTKGHYTGDIVLQVTGELLRKTFRRSDIVGRFGGDEFLVLLKGIASHELLARKCRQIQTGLPQLTQQRAGVPVSCSIGAVMLQKQADITFDELFRQADLALYSAKKAGKGQAAFLSYQRAQTAESR